MEMHWATVWESVADVLPDAPAVTNGDDTRTWAEFDERAARVAAALSAAGLEPQAKVALYLYNGNEYLEGMLGAVKTRAASFNVNYRCSSHRSSGRRRARPTIAGPSGRSSSTSTPPLVPLTTRPRVDSMSEEIFPAFRSWRAGLGRGKVS
jgi:non-ribosomal peptide synthetase component F